MAGIEIGVLSLALVAVPSPAQAADVAALQVVHLPGQRIPPTGQFLPPKQGSGDSDFAGHGPTVELIADLMGTNGTPGTARRLRVWLHVHAKETKSDWTEAGQPYDQFDPGSPDTLAYQIYNTPPGACIYGVNLAGSDKHSYTDVDHDVDVFDAHVFNSFVQRWEVTGDTKGSEAGSKTGANVWIHPLQVTIGPCI